ncbi:MAG: long-chain fatty acid transporter, partial [Bacteroidota bacterium]
FRAGLQYVAISKESGERLTARIGGGFGLSPVQNGYVTPETPDANRWYGTAGLSYVFSEHFSIDASIYATRFQRAATNLETGLSGTFTTIAFAPGLGINYKW